MPNFRSECPVRRPITVTVNSHRDHKPNLKIDFFSRCGYCNAHDEWKSTYYEVDHFIPEYILTIKSKTDYSNLVYSCRSCNNAKRKKWPSNDQSVPNINNEGFVDPCEPTYESHFSRRTTGEIDHETDLGKWMYFALKLHKPHHKIVWNLENLNQMITELKKLENNLDDQPEIKAKLLKVYDEYTAYYAQLRAL
ncbi:TIGR02646 family protein [Chryseolinea serpens]|uniref:TIGR02646 family protein n=1 Tax=Chryseolinea serpens TaxID=947013 RepID=A0A1M5MNX7_9BACT|nr:HNH endonuclease signature motif containing protein [Chryseolinea serpens]SHG79100.1 TIGR02646 family protein [Chryseolinea serpens]